MRMRDRNIFSLDPVDAEAQRQRQPEKPKEPEYSFKNEDGTDDFQSLSAEYQVPPNIIRAASEMGVDAKRAAEVMRDALTQSSGDVPSAVRMVLQDDAATSALLDRAASIAGSRSAPEQSPAQPVKAGSDEPGIIGDTLRMGAGGVVKGSGAVVEGMARGVDAINPREAFTSEMVMGDDGVPTLKMSENDAPPEMIDNAKAAADKMRGFGESLQEGVSTQSRQAIEDSTPDGNLFDPSTWSLGADPSLRGYLMLSADVLGSMAPVIAAAVAGGAPGAIAVGGSQSAGSGSELAREEITAAAQEVGPDGVSRLERESAYYREMVASGIAPDEALRRTVHAGEQLAALYTAPIGAVGGGFTGGIVNKGVRWLSGKGAALRIGGTAGVSGVEEASQELFETLAARKGVEDSTGLDVDLTEGTFGDALLGFLGGAATGGASGIPRRNTDEASPDAPVMDDPAQPAISGPDAPALLPAPDAPAFAPQDAAPEMESAPAQESEGATQQIEAGGQFPLTEQADPTSGVPAAQEVNPLDRPPMGPLSLAASQMSQAARTAPPPKARVRVTTPDGADMEAVFESEDAGGVNLSFNGSPWRISNEEMEQGLVNVTPIDPIREDLDKRRAEMLEAQAEADTLDDDTPTDIDAQPATPDAAFDDFPDDAFPLPDLEIGEAPQSPAQEVAPDIEQARAEVEPEPTEAQKEAGNYKKGHIKLQGLDISIENAKGAERSGTDPDGTPWSVTMPADYGYIRRTEGADGDHVDVYVGDDLSSNYVLVVNQVDPDTRAFDEHKVMLGYRARAEAQAAYVAGFSDGRGKERIGSVTGMSMDAFKAWLKDGDTSTPTRDIVEQATQKDIDAAKAKAEPAKRPATKVAADTPMGDHTGDINGYEGATRDDGADAPLKQAFLKDATRWARKVASLLQKEDGYLKPVNAKGKEITPVRKNDGGVAGSGDVYMELRAPDGGYTVLLTINADSSFGRSRENGVFVNFQIKDGSRFVGSNRYPGGNLAPSEMAAQIRGAVITAMATDTKRDKPTSPPVAAQAQPVERADTIDAAIEMARGSMEKGFTVERDGLTLTLRNPKGKIVRRSEVEPGMGEADPRRREAAETILANFNAAAKESAEQAALDAQEEREQKAQAETAPSQEPEKPAAPQASGVLSALSEEKQARAAELKRRIAEKVRNQTSSGIDPEYITLGAELVALYVEAGTKRFAAILSDFIETTGLTPKEAQAPLRAAYNFHREEMELSGEDITGMDTSDEVMAEVRRAIAGQPAQSTPAPEPDTIDSADTETDVETGEETTAQSSAEPETLSEDDTAEGTRSDEPTSEQVRVDPDGALETAPADEVPAVATVEPVEPDRADGSAPDRGPGRRDDGTGNAGTRSGRGRKKRSVSRAGDRVTPDQPALALEAQATEAAATSSTGNFTITDSLRLGQGGPAEKYADNVAAIETLKAIEAEKRPATDQERAILARYVGWGGLKNAFRAGGTEPAAKGWESKVERLEALLEPEELRAARNSTRAAHYTSQTVVKGVWKLAERLGFAGGAVLEPSAGTGNFLGLMPENLRGDSAVMAVEYDSITARIAKLLYPQSTVFHSGFQDVPLPEGQMTLAIGNPPFGTDQLYFQHLPEVNRRSIHNQFFAASMHALAPDGLLTMVVSRYLMDAKDPSNRRLLAEKGDLVGAIRLPSSAFQENARTEVVTDILAFRRHSVPDEVVQAALAKMDGRKAPSYDQEYQADVDRLAESFARWLKVEEFADPSGSGETLSMNGYFLANKHMVLGDIAATGTMRRSNELNVTLPPSDIAQRLDAAINRIPRGDKMDALGERTRARFAALAEGMRLAVAKAEPGGTRVTDDGKLVTVLEQIDSDGNPVMTELEITSDTPYTNAFYYGDDGKWRREIDALDDKGNKIKQKNADGKVTNLNVKEVEVIENLADIAPASKWGEKRIQQLRDMLPIRDAFRRQVELESQFDAPQDKVEANRAKLKKAYDDFVGAHGPLHTPRIRAIADRMPDGGLILAVEEITSKIGARKLTVKPADILAKRVLMPPEKITRADTIDDAISISLSETGGLDLQRMADLRDTDVESIEAALSKGDKPRGFYDPEQSKWVTSDEYLSGEVRRKLTAAQSAGLEKNVKALEQVAPEPWGAAEITPSLGANWIPREVYSEFLQHLGFSSGNVSYQALTNTYFVKPMGDVKTEWRPTEDRAWSPAKILEAVMNSSPIKVTYTIRDGDSEKTVVDEDATRDSQQKAEEYQNEFQDWVFAEDQRREKLVTIFNNKYNTRVTRQRDGSHLSLPGKNPAIVMRRHQNNAIWRGITDPVVLYDHVVGAGKTFTAIARIMERRRMGLTRKPMVAVPNHLTEQWASDWRTLYPSARLLVAGKQDFEKANRRRLFARIASGDYDGIIIGHSQVGMISIDPAIEAAYLEEELQAAIDAIKEAQEQAAEDGDDQGWRKPLGVAEAERLQNKIEERLARVRSKGKDRLITFQQMGVDDLTIDEAHEFKNLAYSSRMTNTAGMGNKAGSQKALDLHMKLRAMHDAGNSIAFLTGTPISNSVAEMYLVLRNLAPNQLKEMGLENFDAWRTMFVTATSEWEPTEAGSIKEVVRLGREWTNMRTLMDLYYSVSDAVTIDDIKGAFAEDNKGAAFPVPRVRNTREGETRRLVAVTPGPETSKVLDEVVRGFDSLPNISDVMERNAERLRLMDRARKIALDPRAVDPTNAPDPEGGKIAEVTSNIKRIYDAWQDDRGTQIVFLDRSVPKAKGDEKIVAEYDKAMERYDEARNADDEAKIAAAVEALDKFDANDIEARRAALSGGWNAYDDIKSRLIDAGIPPEEIAFVQEANNDKQKAQLFEKVRSGEVRVLLGSTPRMGAGTNVQDRLVALHHVDVTWKPSDIEQREGRIIRQGNRLLSKYGQEEFGVEIIAYATERTVDAKMWDLNGQKLKAINGIRKYDGSFMMEFEDAESASMAEMAALATGDVLMVDRIKLEAARKKLMAKQRTFNKRRNAQRATLASDKRLIEEAAERIAYRERLKSAAETNLQGLAEREAARSIAIDGTNYTDPEKAEAAMWDAIEAKSEGGKKRWKLQMGDMMVSSKDDASKLLRGAFGTPGFEAEIDGKTYIDIADASAAMADAYDKVRMDQASLDTKTMAGVTLNGFPVEVVVSPGYGDRGFDIQTSVMFEDADAFSQFKYQEKDTITAGLFRSHLGTLVDRIDPVHLRRSIENIQRSEEEARKRVPDLERDIAREFPEAAELQRVNDDLDAVVKALGGKEEKTEKASYPAPDTRPTLATLTGMELGSADSVQALRAAAVQWYRQNLAGKTVRSAALGANVTFTRRGANKSVHTKGEDLVRMVPAIREIVAKGQLIRSEEGRRADVKAAHIIAGRVSLDGKVKDVVVTVRETARGQFHYDLSRDMSGGARFRLSEERVPAQLQTADVEADTATLNIGLQATDVNSAAASQALEKALSEAGISDKVTTEIVTGLTVAGRAAEGRYVAGRIAIDPEGADVLGSARHEVIHALRDDKLWGRQYGLFTRAEWQTMVRAARKDKSLMKRIEDAYAGFTPQQRMEEAVAERYRMWHANKDADGPLRSAFRKMQSLLEAIANGLRGAGFASEAAVFKSVADGDVGLRGADITPGAGRDDALGRIGFTPNAPFVTANGKKGGLKKLTSAILTGAMVGGNEGQYSILGLVPMRGLLAEIARDLPGAQRYLSFKEKMDAMRNDLHNEMDDTAKAWRKILVKDRKANKAMMDLMHESTVAQIDPSKRFVGKTTPLDRENAQKYAGTKTGDSALDRMREDSRRRAIYEDLKAKYDALPKEFQEMYVKIRDEYTSMGNRFEDAILANAQKAMEVGVRRAERQYEKRVNEINEEGLKGKARRAAMEEARQDLENAKASNRFAASARLASLRATFESNRIEGPYFPLARFGKLFVTVRDELGQVISFSRFEKQYGRKGALGQMDFAAEMRAKGYRVETGVMADLDPRMAVDPGFVADIEELMGEIGASSQVMDEIWQRWLHTLPDMSVRTNRIHRKGTPGYDGDAFRAFGYQMQHGAHQLARLTYGIDLQFALEDAREDARASKDPVRAGLVVNEMAKRHKDVMNPMSSAWSYRLTTAAFVWYLGITPAAAISNVTQTTVVGIPILGAWYGKGGLSKASLEITRAFGDFATGKGHATESQRLSTEEKEAMEEAYRRGIVDKSQAHDLTGIGETGAEYNRFQVEVMEKIAFFFHHAERMNREVTFLAAYRMAREKGEGRDQAVTTAGDLTWRSHFDYQASSRPRVMQDDWLRVFLVFKNFQINMLWRLFRDIHQSISGKSPELQQEARRQLIGISATMFLHAGIKGVWGYALLKTLLGMFLPGSGEEIEEEIEQALLSVLPNEAVAAFLQGVPGTLMGIDVTNRWGMPELWFRSSGRDLEGSDQYQYWVGELLGAIPGIAEGQFRAMQMFKDGEAWKGFEQMVPKFVRDISRSVRYTYEGATTYNGNPIIDDFTAKEIIAQFSGFTPARLSRQYELNSRDKNAEQRIMRERRRALRNARTDIRRGKGISQATRDRIAEFNQEYPFYAITTDTLLRSIKSGQRASENTKNGVYINPTLAPYINARRQFDLYD